MDRPSGREGERLAGDRRRAADVARRRRGQRADVGAEHDVRVEQREQRLEVAAARGREECVDDRALRVADRRPEPCARPGRGDGRGWRAGAPPPASGRRSARSRRTGRRTCRAARSRSGLLTRLAHGLVGSGRDGLDRRGTFDRLWLCRPFARGLGDGIGRRRGRGLDGGEVGDGDGRSWGRVHFREDGGLYRRGCGGRGGGCGGRGRGAGLDRLGGRGHPRLGLDAVDDALDFWVGRLDDAGGLHRAVGANGVEFLADLGRRFLKRLGDRFAKIGDGVEAGRSC